jgi:drug/metabolite transporter (DMT)-like permease
MKKIFIVIFLTLTAAFTPVAAKFTVNEISPLSLAFFRFGIATSLLLIVFFFSKKKFDIERKDIFRFILLGALVIPINQFCFLVGVKLSSASHSGVFYACTPMFVFIASILISEERFSLKKFFSIFISIVGIVIIFWENIIKVSATGSNVITGDILLFFAVLSWALYLTFSKNMVIKYGTLKTSTVAFLTGMILYIPVFIYDFQNFTLENLTTAGIFGFIHLTFLVAFGGYFIYSYSTKIISTSTLTTLTNTSPVITIFFSWLLLKESLSYFFIIGAVVTLSGIFFIQSIKESQLSAEIK